MGPSVPVRRLYYFDLEQLLVATLRVVINPTEKSLAIFESMLRSG
jgi:hypothetical protein